MIVITDMVTADVEYFDDVVAAFRRFGWLNNVHRRTNRFIINF